MAVYDIIPNGGTFTDVADTLIANGGTGITSAQASTMFTEAANINWQARFKPVVIAEHIPDRTQAWWKGTDGRCGMNIVSANISGSAEDYLLSLQNMLDGNMNNWVYARPAGTSASPFRIADFAGYKPSAKFLDPRLFMIPTSVGNVSGSALNVALNLSGADEYALSWSDFTPLKDYYFGAALVNPNGTLRIARTASNPVTLDVQVSIPTEGFDPQVYTMFPFLAASPILSDRDYGAFNTFYTIPYTKVTEVKVTNTSPTLLLTAKKVLPYDVQVTLTVSNNDSKPITVTNNSMRLRYASKAEDEPLSMGEMIQTIPDFTVPALSTTTVDAPAFQFVQADVWNDCKLWVYLNGGQIKDSVLPMVAASQTNE